MILGSLWLRRSCIRAGTWINLNYLRWLGRALEFRLAVRILFDLNIEESIVRLGVVIMSEIEYLRMNIQARRYQLLLQIYLRAPSALSQQFCR